MVKIVSQVGLPISKSPSGGPPSILKVRTGTDHLAETFFGAVRRGPFGLGLGLGLRAEVS